MEADQDREGLITFRWCGVITAVHSVRQEQGAPMGDCMRIISLSRRALVTLAAATVVTTLLAPAASAAADCAVEYLPVQDGMSWSNLRITGVDGQGNVSGFYSPGRTDHTLVRWTAAGLEVVPRPSGVKEFVTTAGNASGVVVAMADREDGTRVPMTHTPGVGYRELPVPAGYAVWGSYDINDRGDVVGQVTPVGSPEWGVVLWRADGSAPQVVQPAEAPLPRPIALGEDGTMLLDSYSGAFLWRDGVLTKLPDVGHSAGPRALTRDGVIFSSPYGSPRSSWKCTEATGTVEQFSVDGVVESVNQDGLAAGYLDDGDYTPAVWQGTKFVGALPLPADAYSGAADVVGEGGVVAGSAGTKVARWTCR